MKVEEGGNWLERDELVQFLKRRITENCVMQAVKLQTASINV